jgi:hypothetical protein
MKAFAPYLVILLWFTLAETFDELDAWLSIRCIDSGGEFRKEHPDDLLKGQDICYRRRDHE